MLTGPVILDDRMRGQNYLDFLQNELPKQQEGVPLATWIAMTSRNTDLSSWEILYIAYAFENRRHLSAKHRAVRAI